jgi:tetratricopeptide (TPR) repeat protein
MKITLIVISLLTLTGCVNSINQRSEINHARTAYSAQQRGDWDKARRHWAKAIVNANLANEPALNLAVLNYEYGRSLGVTCFFDKSEHYLKTANEVDARLSGPVHMSLLELARLKYFQKDYSAAASYYKKLPSIYKKLNAEEIDPISVAMIYEEYSDSLNNIGNKSESMTYKQRAENLRNENPGKSSGIENTPYGTQCTS